MLADRGRVKLLIRFEKANGRRHRCSQSRDTHADERKRGWSCDACVTRASLSVVASYSVIHPLIHQSAMEAYLASIDAAFSSSSTPSSHAFISLIVVTAQQHAALKDDVAARRSVDQSMIAQRISRSNATMTGVLLDRTASLIEAALQYVADAPSIAILTDTNDRRRDQWPAKASLPAWQQAQAKWATVFK